MSIPSMKINNKQMFSFIPYIFKTQVASKPYQWFGRRVLLPKIIYLCFLSVLMLYSSTVQAQQWAFDIGGLNTDIGRRVVIDGSGNVYVTGTFQFIADFDPGAGETKLTSNGESDVFIAKYTSAGAYQWAIKIGGTGFDYGLGLALDKDDNVYVTGSFSGTVDFDPSAGTANIASNGRGDIFIAKYTTNGAYVWAKGIGGTDADEGADIVVSNSGGVYVTGFFDGSNINFNPAVGTANLTSNGGRDIFIAKYTSAGAYQWAKGIGGASNDEGTGLELDASENVYTTGYFRESNVDFDAGTGTANLSSQGIFDVFIAKYSNSGGYQWAKAIGGSSSDEGTDIALDTDNNVYITGYFSGTVSFDVGNNTASLSSKSSSDVFIAKYSNSGEYQWANAIGGVSTVSSSNRNISRIAIDKNNDLYLTGYYNGNNKDFDPSLGIINFISNGGYDIFLAKYTSQGVYQWAKGIGDSSNDLGQGIAVDNTGNVYATGYFSGNNVSFNTAPNVINLSSAGIDLFLAQYAQPTITSFTPTSGQAGDVVTITGTNFSATASSNTVKLNGVSVTVNTASTTSLQVTIPAGVITEKFTVEVSGQIVTSPSKFTITTATVPTIASFTPTSGKVGDMVTITGTNFSATPLNNTVKFNGVTAQVISASATSLQAIIRNGSTTGKVSVEVGGQTATSANDFTVTTHTITSFTPTSAQVGSIVDITGTSFSTTASNNIVKFNGTTATVSSASATNLQVTVPSGATTGKISVEIGGEVVTSTSDFTVINVAPTITSFSPASALIGDRVLIRGTNFSATASANTVKFNGVTASINRATTTELEVTVPSGATTGKITVEVGGLVGTSSNNISINGTVNSPVITGFSPTSGNVGDTITISGNNFSASSTNIVRFNGTQAVLAFASASELKAVVPVGTSTGKITVEVSGQVATSDADFVVASIEGLNTEIVGRQQVELSWQNVGTVDSIRIERSENSSGGYSTLATIVGGSNIYQDNLLSLPLGNSYFYRAVGLSNALGAVFTSNVSGVTFPDVDIVTSIGAKPTPVFNITPNPSIDGLYQVDLSGLHSLGDGQISVHNHLGQLLMTTKLQQVKASKGILNLSNFGKGVFIIKITTKQLTLTRRLSRL